MEKNIYLLIGGSLSLAAALAHIAIIIGGPDWYRAFGAGEQMAIAAEQGQLLPAFVTLCIAAILAGWGLYAYSGAGLIRRLPFLKTALVLITLIYCVRGTYGFFLPFISENTEIQNMGLAFWFWSSGICLLFGLIHLIGIHQSWGQLSRHSNRAI